MVQFTFLNHISSSKKKIYKNLTLVTVYNYNHTSSKLDWTVSFFYPRPKEKNAFFMSVDQKLWDWFGGFLRSFSYYISLLELKSYLLILLIWYHQLYQVLFAYQKYVISNDKQWSWILIITRRKKKQFSLIILLSSVTLKHTDQ